MEDFNLRQGVYVKYISNKFETSTHFEVYLFRCSVSVYPGHYFVNGFIVSSEHEDACWPYIDEDQQLARYSMNVVQTGFRKEE
jgi:hypothetical protein